VDKLVKSYKPKAKEAFTPLSVPLSQLLVQNDSQASEQDIHGFQSRVGSLIYPSIITRADITKAINLLATFMQNPSQLHIEQADHIIAYLRDTKFYAIEYFAGAARKGDMGIKHHIFDAASDAAFGDDPSTRRSSEGYVFRLYGGAIDWRASRQDCVTTSTTEAELMSLSHAGSAFIWWNRFFKQLGFDPGCKPLIYCDNENTTGMLNKESPKLQTKMKHVDLHQHWLRERVQNQDITVNWISTREMPADGLTKPLGRQRHADFVRLLGLRDLRGELDASEWMS
jgi:hypothetical protein